MSLAFPSVLPHPFHCPSTYRAIYFRLAVTFLLTRSAPRATIADSKSSDVFRRAVKI